MRGTHGIFDHEKLRFVAIQGQKADASDALVGYGRVFYAEVVDVTGIGREMSRSRLVAAGRKVGSLPARTKMMNAGIDGEREIGISVGRPDPIAVKARACSGSRVGGELCIIFDED